MHACDRRPVAGQAPAALAAPSVSTPAITVADGNSVIAAQGPGDTLDFYWQDSSGTFQKEIVAPSGAV